MLWLDENHRAFGEASTPWKKKSGLDISLYCSGIQHYEDEGVVSVKSEAIGHWLEINKGFIPSISILAIMFSAWPTKTEIGEAMKVCCKLVFQQPARMIWISCPSLVSLVNTMRAKVESPAHSRSWREHILSSNRGWTRLLAVRENKVGMHFKRK